MTLPYVDAVATVGVAEHRWLRGPRLLVVQAGWMAMTACILGLFLAAIPGR